MLPSELLQTRSSNAKHWFVLCMSMSCDTIQLADCEEIFSEFDKKCIGLEL